MKFKTTFAAALFLMATSSFATSVAAHNPNDSQITRLMERTNDGEVKLANLAKKNSKNSEIHAFADHMIKDHTDNNAVAKKIAEKNKIAPEENNRSKEMKNAGDQAFIKLKDLKGKEFDVMYIRNQIETHQKVLQDLDSDLIPSAKNTELKAMLQETRAKVAQHLEHAKKIQDSLH